MSDTTAIEGLSWGGRRDSKLIVSPEAVKKVRRTALSPSTADSMSGCSASWVIQRLLPRTQNPFGPAELGTAAHRVFETVLSLDAEQRTTKEALRTVAHLQDDEDGEVCVPESPDDLDRWHSAVTQLVTGLWSVENPRDLGVVGLEIPVADVKVAGVPFLGYVDRLVVKNGVLTLGDYKTGKIPNPRYGDKHGDQIRVYVSALEAHPRFSTPEAGEVIYTQHKQILPVDLSSNAMAETLEKFARAWTTLTKQTDAGEFSTKTGALCGWCPAVSVCPSAQAKGLVERTTFDISGEALGIAPSPLAVPVPTPVFQKQIDRGTWGSISEPHESETPIMYEPKPWEETTDSGELNLNAYAATAAFGIVELAVEDLAKAGAKVSAANVRAYSQTLQTIVNSASESVLNGAIAPLQSGSHTRLRGAIRTTLATLPAPFGGTTQEWEAWVKSATVRTRAIAVTAVSLWSDEIPERPWTALAHDEPADAFEEI